MSQTRTTEILDIAQENLTEALRVIDNDHAYIHQGKYFTLSSLDTIAAGQTLKVGFKTPLIAGGLIHYRPAWLVSSVDKLTVEIFEAAEGVAGGVAQTPINRNRNSTEVSGCTVLKGVTTTGDGDLINTTYIPGSTGVGGTASGGLLSAANEWVLLPDTQYLIKYTNGSSAANIIFTEFQWYEEA